MSARAAAVAFVAGLVLAPAALGASETTVELPAKLAPQIASAKRGKVAVLLPSSIRADVAVSRLFGSGGASANGYDIQLSYQPDCDDGTACFFAEFAAGPIALLPGTRVALAHDLAGSYVPSRCGASCAPASIAWHERGVLYSVQYVLGAKAAMVALADSAIDAGPR